MESHVIKRELEQKGLWHEAAQEWLKIGKPKEADACMTIYYANQAGDAYREEVDRTIGNCPELTDATISQYKKWHEQLRIIYNKHFR